MKTYYDEGQKPRGQQPIESEGSSYNHYNNHYHPYRGVAKPFHNGNGGSSVPNGSSPSTTTTKKAPYVTKQFREEHLDNGGGSSQQPNVNGGAAKPILKNGSGNTKVRFEDHESSGRGGYSRSTATTTKGAPSNNFERRPKYYPPMSSSRGPSDQQPYQRRPGGPAGGMRGGYNQRPQRGGRGEFSKDEGNSKENY